jgi:hypothetical protein
LLPDQKVPALGGPLATIGLNVASLFCGRHFGRLPRVDAHGNDLVIRVHPELDRLARLEHAVEHLRAKHRTAVIGQHQYHRPVVYIVAQLYRAAILVAELKTERHLLVQMLIESNAGEDRRHGRVGVGDSRCQEE